MVERRGNSNMAQLTDLESCPIWSLGALSLKRAGSLKTMRFLQLSAWALFMTLSTLARADEPAKKSEEKPMQGEPVKLTDQALKIHQGGLLIDGHNDLPWQFREKKDRS